MTKSLDSNLIKELVALRREIHKNPELSWDESKTAERISTYLASHGISAKMNVGKTGLTVDIGGDESSARIAIRADMDALPIQEKTDLDFASAIPGVMHACGHDVHSTMAAGAAVLLSQEKNLPFPVRIIFQPAEETGAGAAAMVDDGALKNISYIFGGHVDRHYTPGQIAITNGPVNASTDQFKIVIRGQGGHGARPHESIDAVVVGSLMIMALQTIVSREIDPAFPSVVSVGRFEAGTAHNVIAETAILNGTIRSQHETVRDHMCKAVRRIAESVGQLHGANVEFELIEGTPAVINEEGPADLARKAVANSLGADALTVMRSANMGGEDFGHYLKFVPGCYVRFGSQVAGKEGYPAHSSRFEVDEKAIETGALFFREVCLVAGNELANK